jgi:hypothetical protein
MDVPNPFSPLPQAQSPAFSLDKIDWAKLLRNLVFLVAGDVVAWLIKVIAGIDTHSVPFYYQCAIPALSWGLNLAYRWLRANQPPS